MPISIDFIAKSEGFSDSILLKLLFLWFKRLQIHSDNMDTSGRSHTVVEIRVSWNCHLLSASDDASSICAFLRCFALVQGRSSNEMKPTLTSELHLKSGFLDNGNNPRGSSMFWGPTATLVAPSSYQMLPCTLHGLRANILSTKGCSSRLCIINAIE